MSVAFFFLEKSAGQLYPKGFFCVESERWNKRKAVFSISNHGGNV
jgi:hypothetical protein